MTQKYSVRRPPANLESFNIPAQEDLQALRSGDFAKVIFQSSEGIGERIWTRIREIDGLGNVEATISNDPVSLPLSFGEVVIYHVTDIIDVVWNRE